MKWVKGVQALGKAMDSAGASYASYCRENKDECSRNSGSLGSQGTMDSLNRLSALTQANVDQINANNRRLSEVTTIRKETEARTQSNRQEPARSNVIPTPVSSRGSAIASSAGRGTALVDAATTVANAQRETREKDEARKAAEVEARKKAGEQAAKDQRTREEARKAAEAEAKKKAEELATARGRDKAEKEARERAEKEAQKRAETDYLRSLRAGARARAQTCPDGEGKYYAVAKLPRLPKDVVSCIDVHFRAACPGSANYSTGVGHNFVDGFSCFGSDTVELSPKPQCKVGDVRVEVTDVTPCK